MRRILICTLLSIVAAVHCGIEKKINLRFDLQEGNIHRYTFTATQDISQTLQDQQVDMQQTIIMGYSYEVEGFDDDGNAVVRVAYERIGFMQDGPLGTIEYKSWEKSEDVPIIAQGFSALVGKSFTLTMTRLGEVVDVYGTEQLLDDILNSFDADLDDATRGQIRNAMKSQFGDQAMVEAMEKMFALYPEMPVGVGDSWTVEQDVTSGLPMIMHHTYRVKKIEDSLVYLDVKTDVEPNEEGAHMEMGGIEMCYRLSGTQEGSVVIDTVSGWIVESQMAQDFKGEVEVSGIFGDEPMKWPITVKGVYEMKRE
jgi:hypothetical protein